MARGVALLSGGLDSGVAAASFAREPGNSLSLCLFFDYGQRACQREATASAELARRWGASWRAVPLPWLGELAVQSGARLLPGTGDLPQGTIEHHGDADSARAVWVPARNAVFVATAAAFAEVLDAEVLVAGFNREEAATFADNSPEFVRAACAFLASGTRHAVRVVSPTLAWDKAQIVAAARALGFAASDFWSCYEGGDEPCGRCESCLRSRWQR
ncbi:MAG: 7-cyano-7-deazaguanine synthase [Planctomycetota bacterium]